LKNPIKDLARSIREINRKYAKPRIKLSRNVKIALLALRLYLLFLILMLLYRFVSQVVHI
jgi:hypothetical protein